MHWVSDSHLSMLFTRGFLGELEGAPRYGALHRLWGSRAVELGNGYLKAIANNRRARPPGIVLLNRAWKRHLVSSIARRPRGRPRGSKESASICPSTSQVSCGSVRTAVVVLK